MTLSDNLTLMSMEAQNDPNWKYDHNTTVLLIIQNNLVGLLQAIKILTNDFKHLERIEMTGLISGLAETTEWLQDNTKLNERQTDGA